jgi:hypothetical protein
LFQHLFHFAEALGRDPAVPKSTQDQALKLQYKPKGGPIKRCGDITNTDKHAARKVGETHAVLVRGGHLPWNNLGSQPALERSYQVQFTDSKGNQTTEDALALATESYHTWRDFLVDNSLIES